MGEFEVDRATVRDAIALATRAPSVHNSQPWRWLIGPASVHLMADRTRRLAETDPDGRDLLISCGAALHHARVAFAALGYGTVVHRIPNPAVPDHLASVEFRPVEPSIEDIKAADAITRRRTDRRRFSSWPVQAEHLDLLVRRAAGEGTIAFPVTDPTARAHLAAAIESAAQAQERDPRYRSEMDLWSGRSWSTDEGVPAANAPSGEERHGDTRMRTFAVGSLDRAPVRRGEVDAAELVVVATSGDDPLSRLRAGEAVSAVLLAATELGLATCPLSQPLEVMATRHLVRDVVLGGAAVPQLVVRVGWAPVAAAPLPESPRRAVADVCAPLDQAWPRRG
ncbi:MAG TPA: nitroreductase family protein [Actinokineospora sp.]|nr:nitroreductase family protein [Actinokineospora sp.]